jgi:hypothetical protein
VHDTGAFQLDGNAVDDGDGDDWANVCRQVTITDDAAATPANVIPDECASAGHDTNGATAVAWASDGSQNATIFTGGGSKDPQNLNQWAWKDGSGGLPDKDNLQHSFAARYSLPSTGVSSGSCPSGTASTCEVLFFGSDRFDNSGDAQQGFWFFQNAIGLGTNAVGGGSGFIGLHRAGDVLVISDFSNGGGTSTITVYKWDPTCTKAAGTCGDVNLRTLETSDAAKCATSLGSGDPFCGIVNPSNGTVAPWSFTDKSGLHTYLNGELYEGGINLSLLGLADECFAGIAAETRSSTSTTATLKDFVLGSFGHCDSSVVTTPKNGSGGAIPQDGLSIGTGTVTAKDSAQLTVHGTPTWSGTLSFHLCGPIASGTCTTGGADIGSVSVNQSTQQPVLSDAATLTSAGRYCWRGDFVADTEGVPPSSDSSTGECFQVNPVPTTLATTAGPDVDFGQAIADTANLSGTATAPGTNGPNATYPSINATNGAAAGGTITFVALGPDNCTTTAYTSGTFAVSGDNASYGPASFIPSSPGTYHWKASYTGDSPNTLGTSHNDTCNDTAEDVVVNQVPTGITTHQFVFPQDKATITASGGGALSGSVTFQLYDTLAHCTANGGTPATGQLYSEGPLTVSGASPQSKTTNNTSVRLASNATVYWRVTYTSTNQAQLSSSSVCVESTAVTYAGNDAGIPIP